MNQTNKPETEEIGRVALTADVRPFDAWLDTDTNNIFLRVNDETIELIGTQPIALHAKLSCLMLNQARAMVIEA